MRGRAARAGGGAGAAALRRLRARVGARAPVFRCPACGGADVEVLAGDELEVESIEVEEDTRMHRVKVRVVEDALDANNTIARGQPRRLRPRRRHGGQPDERAGRGQDDAARARRCAALDGVRAGVLEGDVQGSLDADRLARPAHPGRRSSTPTAASAASATSTRTWSARRCRRCRSTSIDLLIIENVGNLVCPAEFRVGEDARDHGLLGRRGRGQAAQVPADVPRLRARDRQQDRPARARRLRHRPVPATTSTRVHPGVPRMLVSARTGEGVDAFRDWLVRAARRGRGAPA